LLALPWLIALFSFILINNLWGIFPFTLMPTTAHAGWAYGLAIMVWVVYNAVGIAKHGFGGYLKLATLPAGVPVFMWWLIIPLEFFSNIIVRPITLALRLFANMFAGHLLVLVFVLGGEYLLFESEPIVNKIAGVVALIFSMAIFGLEVFVHDPMADPLAAHEEYGIELSSWEDLPVADTIVMAVAHRAYLERPPAACLDKLIPGGCFIDVKSKFARGALEAAGVRVWKL